MCRRVAHAIAQAELPEDREKYEELFFDMIYNQFAIPAGRILRNAGMNRSALNCFSLSIRDSIEEIAETIKDSLIIASEGGGVGIDFSHIRPAKMPLKRKGGLSSGPVSFMKIIDAANGVIETGGQRRCFAKGTRIQTKFGLVKIEDIVNGEGSDYVYTHKGLKKIINKFNNGVQDCIRISTASGHSVLVTKNHKMCVLGNNGEFKLKKAGEFIIGEKLLLLLGKNDYEGYVVIPEFKYNKPKHSTTLNAEVTLPTVLNEDLAYFIGAIFSDGTFSQDKIIQICIGEHETEFLNKIVHLGKNLFGLEPKIKQGGGKCLNVKFYSRILVEWCKMNGFYFEDCRNLRVPEKIFRSNSSVVFSFIAGLFDGDGHNGGSKSGYSIKITAGDFLKDVQLLLLSNGIMSKIHISDRSEYGWSNLYSLNVVSHEFKKRFFNSLSPFSTKINRSIGKKDYAWKFDLNIKDLGIRDKWFKGIWTENCNGISYSALSRICKKIDDKSIKSKVENLLKTIECEIVNIEDVGAVETYDLEIEDIHLLSGNGFYTSNSALLAMLDVSHPDIEKFLDAKTKEHELNNFNISVTINNKFMDAVRNDEDWVLEFRGQVFKKVRARSLWDRIIKNAYNYAEPGIVNIDRIRQYNNSEYFAPFSSLNPCLSGDTLLVTDNGIQKIGDIVGYANIWNGERFSKSKVWETGRKKVIKIITNSGYEFVVTPDHKFQLSDGSWEAAQNLLNRKIKCTIRDIPINGVDKLGSTNFELLGFAFGDGSYHKPSKRFKYIYFTPNKDSEVVSLFEEYFGTKSYYQGTKLIINVPIEYRKDFVGFEEILPNRIIPDHIMTLPKNKIASFLRGLFSANGTVLRKYKKVSLVSSNKEMLKQVQILLSLFGIKAKLWWHDKASEIEFPNGKYKCNQSYHLIISRKSLEIFRNKIGFIQSYKNEELNDVDFESLRSEDDFETVVEIQDAGEELVYDFTEPDKHEIIINGFHVHNCAEAVLSDSESCDLGSIVLPNFVTEKTVRWKEMEKYIHLLIRLLDNVLTINKYPLQKIELASQRTRRLGAGVIGLGDVLLKLELRYGSEESLLFVEKLFKFIRDTAYQASINLAIEKGTFPEYSSRYLDNNFIKTLPVRIRKQIEDHGIRNVALLAIAPTGTVSLLTGYSSGIEPVFSKAYWRKDRIGKRAYVHNLLKKYDGNIPDFFVDSYDITPEEHLLFQATVGQYVDNSISKTINIPKDYPLDKLNSIILKYIEEVKGITIYRDTSRKNQVLTPMTDEEIKKYLSESREETFVQECKTGTCDL
jgi:ribonucleoside-diphosphate reductase alpha chain